MNHLPGLDLLRAIAIVWVMLFHSFLVGGLGADFAWLSRFGWAGVDIFFVLSGFLIGTQVLQQLQRGQGFSLGGFYARRAWRILPAFAVVLALYVAFPKDDPRDPPPSIAPEMIDETRLLLLEDGHCLKDHALAACNRPELRAHATMMGTSLHTLVQMVDNGLGLTLLPEIAINGGILEHTHITARPLSSSNASREIALVWRKGSPRDQEFNMLADILRKLYKQ